MYDFIAFSLHSVTLSPLLSRSRRLLLTCRRLGAGGDFCTTFQICTFAPPLRQTACCAFGIFESVVFVQFIFGLYHFFGLLSLSDVISSCTSFSDYTAFSVRVTFFTTLSGCTKFSEQLSLRNTLSGCTTFPVGCLYLMRFRVVLHFRLHCFFGARYFSIRYRKICLRSPRLRRGQPPNFTALSTAQKYINGFSFTTLSRKNSEYSLSGHNSFSTTLSTLTHNVVAAWRNGG